MWVSAIVLALITLGMGSVGCPVVSVSVQVVCPPTGVFAQGVYLPGGDEDGGGLVQTAADNELQTFLRPFAVCADSELSELRLLRPLHRRRHLSRLRTPPLTLGRVRALLRTQQKAVHQNVADFSGGVLPVQCALHFWDDEPVSAHRVGVAFRGLLCLHGRACLGQPGPQLSNLGESSENNAGPEHGGNPQRALHQDHNVHSLRPADHRLLCDRRHVSRAAHSDEVDQPRITCADQRRARGCLRNGHVADHYLPPVLLHCELSAGPNSPGLRCELSRWKKKKSRFTCRTTM